MRQGVLMSEGVKRDCEECSRGGAGTCLRAPGDELWRENHHQKGEVLVQD